MNYRTLGKTGYKGSEISLGTWQLGSRRGKAFYKGETFSGVDYYTGVRAAKRLKEELGTDDLAATALRWFLMHPEVSVIIPGASLPEPIVNNAKASELPALSDKEIQAVRRIYDEEIRPLVHQLW